jgi:MYXO-CTERM domain-containing protein
VSDGGSLAWDISGASQGHTKSLSGSVLLESSEAFQILGDESTGAPEPGSFGLLAAGVLGMAGLLRRRTAG